MESLEMGIKATPPEINPHRYLVKPAAGRGQIPGLLLEMLNVEGRAGPAPAESGPRTF